MTSHHFPWITVAFLALLCWGCSRKDRIDRYQLTGKVTYQGAPVGYGTIVLEPQAGTGHGGLAPTCYAKIEDGIYTTPRADSPVAGSYQMKIRGFDKAKMKSGPAPGEFMETPVLFDEYVIEIQVPTKDSQFDIVVPSSKSEAKR